MNDENKKKYEKYTFGWLREQAKKDGFDNIRDWQNWIIQNERDIWAQNEGYKDYDEYKKRYKRNWQRLPENKEKKKCWYLNNTDYNRGENNPNCSDFLGIVVGEDVIAIRILSGIFEHIKKITNHSNPGFDFVCKNPRQEFIDTYPQFRLDRDKEYRIDVKTARLKTKKFTFAIDYNKIADYFLLIGTNDEYNEDKIFCLYSWLFKNNDMVRFRLGGSGSGPLSGYSLKQFYDRGYIIIPNKENDLLYFKKWRIDDKYKFYDGNGSQ